MADTYNFEVFDTRNGNTVSFEWAANAAAACKMAAERFSTDDRFFDAERNPNVTFFRN